MTEDRGGDLDLRVVRYFVSVAEHRHFGRAAAELRIAQPSLSRQVARLEKQLGVELFTRGPRGTRLTSAGETFLAQAKQVLQAADNAVAAARAAATGPRKVTVGYTPGIIVTPAVRLMRRLHPDVDVQALHLGWNEARPALLDYRVDVVVTRLPLDTTGLRTSPLYEEPRLLLVPLDHRLAGKESVSLDDIADEPLPKLNDPAWDAFWRVDPRPDGRPAPDGPLVTALEDKNELIAAGLAVAIVPAGVYNGQVRPDLTTIPLHGVEPARVIVAFREGERSSFVTYFHRAAAQALRGPAESIDDQPG